MNEKKTISTLLWDQDNTLMDFNYSMRKALTDCFKHFGRETSEEVLQSYEEINNDYWRRMENGEITRDELKLGRFQTLFQRIGIKEIAAEDFWQLYQDALGSTYTYIDDSLNICKDFRGTFRQYIVTNGLTHTQRKKISLSGFGDIMDGIFISEELGEKKPDQAFFDKCLEAMEEKDPDRILIIGDSLSSDIKGGIQAGIRTCWYNPAGTFNDTKWQAEFEITDLHQLYAILGMR